MAPRPEADDLPAACVDLLDRRASGRPPPNGAPARRRARADSLARAKGMILRELAGVLPQLVELGEQPRIGADHAAETAKARQQLLGERLGVLDVDAVEQEELQELVVGQRLGPGLQKARAQALAMAVVVLAPGTPGGCGPRHTPPARRQGRQAGAPIRRQRRRQIADGLERIRTPSPGDCGSSAPHAA